MATATATRTDLMAAIRGLSAARDLPPEVIVDALKAALVSAYHKMPGAEATSVTVDIDEKTGDSRVIAHFVVVEEQFIEDPGCELTLDQARQHEDEAALGDHIDLDVTPDDFGRIAAQTAKQVILQRIREAEREQTYSTYADREGEIVYGTVQTVNRDVVTVALDRVEAILPKSGQIPGEAYVPNQRLRVYVSEVKRSPKGPQVVVSRTQREMLKRLMELEIPEVFQGVVEIKEIAREAGSRSKVAVWAHQEGVDPVGACVGMRGVRIQALVRELGGEKIDIVEWDPDPRVFIAHALSPAKVMHVWLDEDTERRTANVIVPDGQLSLAIGREGQNARLAAKLTGWRIDIRAESEASDVIERVRLEEAARAAERVAALEPPAPPAEVVEEVDTETTDVEVVEEGEELAAEIAAEIVAEPTAEAGHDVVEIAAETTLEPETDETEEAEAFEESPKVEVPAAAATKPTPPVTKPVVPETKPDPPAPKTEEATPERPARDQAELDELLQPAQKVKRQKRRLIRDPKTGELVAQTQRKGTRRRPTWESDIERWEGEDLGGAQGFTESDFIRQDDDEEDDDKELVHYTAGPETDEDGDEDTDATASSETEPGDDTDEGLEQDETDAGNDTEGEDDA